MLGLVLLCAFVHAAARAEEPGVLRALPPVSDASMPQFAPAVFPTASPPPTRLPSIVDDEPRATFLYGFETSDSSDPFAVRPAGYTSADPNAESSTTDVPSGATQTRKSLLHFSGLQDPNAPEEKPDDGAGSAGAEVSDAASGGAEGQSGAEGAGGEKKEEQTYGQAPTNNALQFLRQVDVLLKPGAWQFDSGFVYTLFSNDFPLPLFDMSGEVVGVVEAEVRRRLLYTPLAVRYGLRKNVQLFCSLPAGFSNTQLSTLGISETRNVSGIGDLTAGASVHLIKGEDKMPDLIGTIGFTAPTGKFDTPLFGLVPGSNLGQGFWALAGQGLFINRYDPVIVFYGGGFRHLFEREFDGVLFAPGEQANYMFGVGFSVNDRVTLSSTFQGFYITNTFINSVNVRGSNLEPMSMRFSATIVRNCRIIEPFVQIGVTDSAPRVNAGIVVTFY
ncbi:MAG: hypothetical protein WD063_07045 [Pirellulales bacterium]